LVRDSNSQGAGRELGIVSARGLGRVSSMYSNGHLGRISNASGQTLHGARGAVFCFSLNINRMICPDQVDALLSIGVG